MSNPQKLGEAVKRYRYEKKIKLYGKKLEVISDPVHPEDDDVFVDAREEGSGNVR